MPLMSCPTGHVYLLIPSPNGPLLFLHLILEPTPSYSGKVRVPGKHNLYVYKGDVRSQPQVLSGPLSGHTLSGLAPPHLPKRSQHPYGPGPKNTREKSHSLSSPPIQPWLKAPWDISAGNANHSLVF